MTQALTAAHNYIMSEEGTVEIATVAVLLLAIVVMLAYMISYPEISEVFGLAG